MATSGVVENKLNWASVHEGINEEYEVTLSKSSLALPTREHNRPQDIVMFSVQRFFASLYLL
jgi:hypothetical protein